MAHELVTPAPATLEDGVPRIRAIGFESQAGGELRVCGVVAAIAQGEIGWQAVSGRYAGHDCEYVRNYPDDSVRHCWNVLPDGTIVDATANQFDVSEPMPRVIPTGDPRQTWYLVATGLGNNVYAPGWASNHPARRVYADRAGRGQPRLPSADPFGDFPMAAR